MTIKENTLLTEQEVKDYYIDNPIFQGMLCNYRKDYHTSPKSNSIKSLKLISYLFMSKDDPNSLYFVGSYNPIYDYNTSFKGDGSQTFCIEQTIFAKIEILEFTEYCTMWNMNLDSFLNNLNIINQPRGKYYSFDKLKEKFKSFDDISRVYKVICTQQDNKETYEVKYWDLKDNKTCHLCKLDLPRNIIKL